MRIRKKERIQGIHLEADDVITLHYVEEIVDAGGNVIDSTDQKVMSESIGRTIDINEAVIFDVEKGDFGPDVKDGIGGAFLSTEGKNVQ